MSEQRKRAAIHLFPGLPACRSFVPMQHKRPFYRKKRVIVPVTLVVLLVLLYLFRFSALRMAGNYLIDEDPPEHVACMFLLGGNGYDRGVEGARLYKLGFADKLVCTGASSPPNYKAVNISMPESEVTKAIAVQEGVPAEMVEAWQIGTGTWGEAKAITAYCAERNIKKAMVISDRFHTHRVRSVFEPKFEAAGIELVLCGAPSTRYSEETWWQSEQGLIMVNNEYVKHVYYWLKY